jgi:hypothetical protein
MLLVCLWLVDDGAAESLDEKVKNGEREDDRADPLTEMLLFACTPS